MELSRDVVSKVAELARLKVSKDELDSFVADLSSILGYVHSPSIFLWLDESYNAGGGTDDTARLIATGLSKNIGQGGKLRLMYEANPMAFLVEQAGGAATNGEQRILDIQPEKLHQRVAVVLGSKNEVDRVTQYHLEAKQTP